MKKAAEFFKKETVLTVAWVLAVVSMFIVRPDKEYIEYIDFGTLGILFCLMAVMAGLRKCGFFEMIAGKLLKLSGSMRGLELILVLLCFFFGMLITNDVALITFVPLALEVLRVSDRKDRVIPVVVMQTIAANLGSMATPIGNPQNLYLYAKSGQSFNQFIVLMLPYTLISFAVIVMTVVVLAGKAGKDKPDTGDMKAKRADKPTLLKELVYIALFLLSIMVVVRIIPVEIMVIAIAIIVLVMDRDVLLKIDYSLLITFTGFFIFVGNMGRIPQFQAFLSGVLIGNEFLTAALLSQVVSNVPAAILLSGFTADYRSLIIGTNIGGLGTLIASMASLISYKFAAKEYPEKKGKYLLYFTVVNVIYLAAMVICHFALLTK